MKFSAGFCIGDACIVLIHAVGVVIKGFLSEGGGLTPIMKSLLPVVNDFGRVIILYFLALFEGIDNFLLKTKVFYMFY